MKFNWIEYEIENLLPNNWSDEVLAIAKRYTVFRNLGRTPITSREEKDVYLLRRGRVSGEIVLKELPWLYDAYQTIFLKLASEFTEEDVFCAKDIRYGIVLNVAKGNKMRFECHVDSNPLEGLLFCTNQPSGYGGELVVSNHQNVIGIRNVDKDCSIIYPSTGKLVIFDASKFPHYVRPLVNENDLRVVIAMNFYTSSHSEKTRPEEINKYLFE